MRSRFSGRSVALHVEELERRTVPTLVGQQLFPSDNPWNQRITDAPVAGNSSAIIGNIVNRYGNGRLHPDFGQLQGPGDPLYGIPYNVVHGNTQPRISVVIDDYADESDVVAAPIPANAVLEGDFATGPNPDVGSRGDSHLIVYDVDNNVAYEFYQASRPSENADGRWHAAQQTVWDMKTNTFRTLGWTSADAAGLAILPGLVRPDEALPINQGGQGVINHAIRFTLRNAVILDQFLYPASHTANPGNTNTAVQPPMGARFRLKSSVDISQLNPQSRIVAQAMKDYGMIVADNGSNFYFSGASYAVDASNQRTVTWNDDDIQDSLRGLKSLHFADFEVVDLTPAVTSLSTNNGPAGTTVTLTGRNFSGAAGHLQVLFGSMPSTSVTVVDDTRVVAVAPAGAGTVDVRVRSGVITSNPDNVTNPIFGYGISPVTPAARFTYGGALADAPPTVASPAAAAPAAVSGRSTSLSVRGADNGGEPALVYHWSVVSAPAGAAPSFAVNHTNGAKNTTVAFDRAGAYVFRATITDLLGQSITSDVAVSVSQSLSQVVVSPASATVRNGGRVQFRATALDQFGQALAQQPAAVWSLTGIGRISSGGLYTAPKRGRGTAVVHVSMAGIEGLATVLVAAGRRKALAALRMNR